MARKPTGNPPGPVPKEIDWQLFEQLCALQCTQSEIASCLKINIDTVRDRCKLHYGEEYSEVYKKYSEEGKCSLRRYQFLQAKTKPNMAIWLGKQWLHQKDTFDAVAPNNDKMLGDILAEVKSMKEQPIAPLPETNSIDSAGDAQI